MIAKIDLAKIARRTVYRVRQIWLSWAAVCRPGNRFLGWRLNADCICETRSAAEESEMTLTKMRWRVW